MNDLEKKKFVKECKYKMYLKKYCKYAPQLERLENRIVEFIFYKTNQTMIRCQKLYYDNGEIIVELLHDDISKILDIEEYKKLYTITEELRKKMKELKNMEEDVINNLSKGEELVLKEVNNFKKKDE